jgi:class 3 adenylate cyclase
MAIANRTALIQNLIMPCYRKNAAYAAGLGQWLRKILRKGGLRLKIVSFLILIVIATVGILDFFIIRLMTKAVSRKAIEVVETSLLRISEVSRLTLLERTYENKINLDEILQSTRAAEIDGLLDINIFVTLKQGNSYAFNFFTGFEPETNKLQQLDKTITARLLAAADETLFREDYRYHDGVKVIPAYRYVQPIFTEYEGQSHLLGAVVMAYSREAIYGAARSVIQISILTTLAVLIASIAAIYLFGSRFIRPILIIANAASKVTSGNFNVRLDIRTNDEIEDLGKRFNTMVQELRRKEMMQKFISSSTIDMIQKEDQRHLRLGGQHRTMTLLFSDIRNFTTICEDKPPHQVVAIANSYLNLQAGIIKRRSGDIDKFVGDEIMALFSGSDSVDQAVNAAIEIQRTIRQENIRRKRRGLTTVEVGIGINHGEVVVGNIGSYDRMDFTAMGSVVNLASKLCAKARPSMILIEQETYQRLGNSLEYGPEDFEIITPQELESCNAKALILRG